MVYEEHRSGGKVHLGRDLHLRLCSSGDIRQRGAPRRWIRQVGPRPLRTKLAFQISVSTLASHFTSARPSTHFIFEGLPRHVGFFLSPKENVAVLLQKIQT